jgi:hypothetical protein
MGSKTGLIKRTKQVINPNWTRQDIKHGKNITGPVKYTYIKIKMHSHTKGKYKEKHEKYKTRA